MLIYFNFYLARHILFFFVMFNQSILIIMKINIFVSSSYMYNSITIDTDDLELCSVFGLDDPKPSLFLDDVISDLIDKN